MLLQQDLLLGKMNNISINLLPPENALNLKHQKKFKVIQRISTVALLIMVFLASVTIPLRIMQDKNFQNIDAAARSQVQTIEQSRTKEIALTVLKNRISLITKVNNDPQIQTNAYNLVNEITSNLAIGSIQIDKNGLAAITLNFSDANSLSVFLNNMTSKIALDKLSQVSVDSLGRGPDGVYRADFKLTLNK